MNNDQFIEVSCKYCGRTDNDFVLLKGTGLCSGLKVEMNRQGMLRIRYFYDTLKKRQDIINIKFCPMCGRKLVEDA